MKKSVKILGSVLAIFLVLIFGFFVWADSNGVWVDAKDIRGSTFGGDEGDALSNYVFVNPVDFQDEVQVTVIKSNSGEGNVNIHLS